MARAEAGGLRQTFINIVEVDECWKERVRKENKIARYQWPYSWGFTVDAYYQLEDDLTGGRTASRGRPPPIKPIDLDQPSSASVETVDLRMTSSLGPIDTGRKRRKTTFPATTSAMIGWAQSLTPVMERVRPLERQARPVADIRKAFGWPPDAE